MFEPKYDRGKMYPKAVQSKFVDPNEFLTLVLSRRVLMRSDDKGNGKVGLLDSESGQRFIIDLKDLMSLKLTAVA